MNPQLESTIVELNASLKDVLAALDRSGLEIVMAVGEAGRLEGVLTDGDVRRALLRGANLEDRLESHIRRDYVAVGALASRADVLDLMRARGIGQIPIVDAERRVLGLHTLPAILGATPRPNWAVIMAGGRGERLRPATDVVPKPMIRVAGRPILERTILHLVGFGIRSIFVAVNYKAELIEAHFGDGSQFGCRIEYLREEQPLGTGGALSLLPLPPSEALLVVNGDLVTQWDVGQMLAAHESAGSMVTVGIHEYHHVVPFGVVDVQGDRILAIREKPRQAWSTNAGIYVLEPELLTRVPKQTSFSLPMLLEDCLARGERVGAFWIEDDWIDVGRPDELGRARGEG